MVSSFRLLCTVSTLLLVASITKSMPGCLNPECKITIPTHFTAELTKKHFLEELSAAECDLSSKQADEFRKLMVNEDSTEQEAEHVIDLIRRYFSDGSTLLTQIKMIEVNVGNYSRKRSILELASEIKKKECDTDKTIKNAIKIQKEVGKVTSGLFKRLVHLLLSSRLSVQLDVPRVKSILNLYSQTVFSDEDLRKERENKFMESQLGIHSIIRRLGIIRYEEAAQVALEFLKLPYYGPEENKEKMYIARLHLINDLLQHSQGIEGEGVIDGIYKSFRRVTKGIIPGEKLT